MLTLNTLNSFSAQKIEKQHQTEQNALALIRLKCYEKAKSVEFGIFGMIEQKIQRGVE